MFLFSLIILSQNTNPPIYWTLIRVLPLWSFRTRIPNKKTVRPSPCSKYHQLSLTFIQSFRSRNILPSSPLLALYRPATLARPYKFISTLLILPPKLLPTRFSAQQDANLQLRTLVTLSHRCRCVSCPLGFLSILLASFHSLDDPMGRR